MKFTKNGTYDIDYSATDDCGKEVKGTRQVVIIQNLRAGDYINIAEAGDTATISADISADYYDKTQINELIANIETVQFRKVLQLPSIGAANTIYLVPKDATENSFYQYIWDSVENDWESIGDTDIDLSDYYTKDEADANFYKKADVYTKTESDANYYKKADVYTKTESDNKYPLKSDVYTKTESDNRYYQKSETYSQTEADNKFQQKLSARTNIDPLYDNDTISNVDPVAKTVTNTTMLRVWEYIKGKFVKTAVGTVTDTTMMGTVDTDVPGVVKQFSALTLWEYIVTKLSKLIASGSTHNEAPTSKAVFDYVEARRRYLHVMTRYNNDAKEYPMGWCAIITDNATETYESIAKWLYDNQHRTLETSYYWVGGCCGTTGVRNSADTGTTYIGRVTSGAYSEDGTTIKYKYDYNAWVGVNGERCTVHSHPLMKLTT